MSKIYNMLTLQNNSTANGVYLKTANNVAYFMRQDGTVVVKDAHNDTVEPYGTALRIIPNTPWVCMQVKNLHGSYFRNYPREALLAIKSSNWRDATGAVKYIVFSSCRWVDRIYVPQKENTMYSVYFNTDTHKFACRTPGAFRTELPTIERKRMNTAIGSIASVALARSKMVNTPNIGTSILYPSLIDYITKQIPIDPETALTISDALIRKTVLDRAYSFNAISKAHYCTYKNIVATISKAAQKSPVIPKNLGALYIEHPKHIKQYLKPEDAPE